MASLFIGWYELYTFLIECGVQENKQRRIKKELKSYFSKNYSYNLHWYIWFDLLWNYINIDIRTQSNTPT